ncbi:MAG: protein kinase, partial [Bryobacteraceae bacterium]
MDRTLWARIKEAFSIVIACGPDDAREALLQACNGDDELVQQVRPLVEEHFRILSAVEMPAPAAIPDTELPRIIAGRYRLIARLGSGSFGDVYRVSDEVAGGELALKVLRSPDPVALHYFKREFRSLADTYHPNIVRLRELIAYQDRWMFTMEFVDGVDLLQFLNRQSPGDRAAALRSCLLQLGEGIKALHRGRLLHRDVKPSNVLVTSAGRVVLLDFGLVHSFDKDPLSLVTFAGTPDYMSPEQAAGIAAAEPSDWYAFGVLLYQSLTGKLPFYGNFVEVLRRKQLESPAPPADLAPDVPAQLNTLCLNLLERDPLKRASYQDVIRSLRPGVAVPVQESRRPPIVGRGEPLRRLADAIAAADDRPALIHICGPSGIGKTVLLREFAARLSKDPSVLVFAGRCYEGETVPYQALDDLIDHIGQYFRRLPRDRVESLLPRNFAVLVKMFPVLAPFLSSGARSGATFSSMELRTRALAALRELLGRLRERHRIALVIDDLQWGDVDGCVALNELFSSADSPAILAVLAYRSEDIAASPSLKALRGNTGQPSNRTTTFIDLGHLDIAECRQLAQSLLAQPFGEDTLQRIAEQSGGNPFLVQEIVRWINVPGVNQVLPGPFSLADVVRSRVDELRPESKHFLELAAVAG